MSTIKKSYPLVKKPRVKDDKKFYTWTKEIAKGWMVFYNGEPYWPLFGTKAEAMDYRKWKTGNSPKSYVDRIEVESIVRVKHKHRKVKNVKG